MGTKLLSKSIIAINPELDQRNKSRGTRSRSDRPETHSSSWRRGAEIGVYSVCRGNGTSTTSLRAAGGRPGSVPKPAASLRARRSHPSPSDIHITSRTFHTYNAEGSLVVIVMSCGSLQSNISLTGGPWSTGSSAASSNIIPSLYVWRAK